MPTASFGQKVNTFDRKSKFIELSSQGQKFKLRFVGGYAYEGKHFTKLPEGKWEVLDCVRINNEEDCAKCNQYFELVREAKEIEDKQTRERALADAKRNYAPKVTFYYPVLNRETGEGAIFKTTLSVRLKLEQEVESGMDVTKFDYVVMRTEKPGSDYYSLTRMDSSMTPALTANEEQAVKQLSETDLENLIKGKKGSGNLQGKQENASEEDYSLPEAAPASTEEANEFSADEIADDIPF